MKICLNDFLYKLQKFPETDCFVYNIDYIENIIVKLKQDFPNMTILYAMKANSNDEILKQLSKFEIGVDCASYEEFQKAKKFNFKVFSCTGPGFSSMEVANIMLNGGTFDFDSVDQFLEFNKNYNEVLKSLGIRIACGNSTWELVLKT